MTLESLDRSLCKNTRLLLMKAVKLHRLAVVLSNYINTAQLALLAIPAENA